MAERPPYCHYTDVLRAFDALEADKRGDLSAEDKALIRDAVDDVGSDFEIKTGHAFRRTRVGRSGAPETYEYQGIEGSHRSPPVRVSLDHPQVLPFDSTEDDVLEYRSGRDEWTPITDQGGDEFVLDYEHGTLKVYRWLIQRIVFDVPDERYLRASYRYGALGGSQEQGGQTTLDGSLGSNDTDTSVSVANAARLPSRGILYLGGDSPEYVRLTDVDLSTDTLTVDRGVRATDAASHDDGDVVHFCPEGVRRAMAGRAAQELQEYDWFTDYLVDTGDGISPSDRIDRWASDYESLLAKYSGVRKL